MFEGLAAAPPDPILDLKETFKADDSPDKVNLTVGVYKDGDGTTPIFRSVKLAEARMLEDETSKEYLKIEGGDDYAAAVQELVFGVEHEAVTSRRAVTAQTPGGTAALRVGAEFLKRIRPGTRVWMSDPTWPNHANVFRAAGLEVETYPYYDADARALAADAMLAGLREIPSGGVVLLHGCCHNPTGVDPTAELWQAIAGVVAQQDLLPFVDLAYQGLGDGLREDTVGVMALCQPEQEMMVASSFSKNFGLYRERVGALTLVAASKDSARVSLSHIKKCIRSNYSNPPSHGAAIVTQVLQDAELRSLWEGEVKGMCERIKEMRSRLAEGLGDRLPDVDVSFIARQRGIFSYTGLTREQVLALRSEHSIYMLDSGRINVAGLNQGNVDKVCDAIADVLSD